MRTIHKILLVAAGAASFTLVNSALADQNTDPNLLQYSANGNARTMEQMQSTAMAPNSNSDRDPNLMIYPHYYNIMPPKTLQLWIESNPTPVTSSAQDPNLVNQTASIAGTPKQKQFTEEQQFQVAPGS